MDYALLQEIGRVEFEERLREAERAHRLSRSRRFARLPYILKAVLLAFA